MLGRNEGFPKQVCTPGSSRGGCIGQSHINTRASILGFIAELRTSESAKLRKASSGHVRLYVYPGDCVPTKLIALVRLHGAAGALPRAQLQTFLLDCTTPRKGWVVPLLVSASVIMITL